MRRRLVFPLAVLVLLLGMLPIVASAQGAPEGVIPGQYIVVLKPGADPQSVAQGAARDHGAEVLHVYQHALNGFAFRGSEQAAQALSRNPNVQYINQDRVVQAIARPGNGGGGGSTQPKQSLPTGIDRIDAEQSTTAKIDGKDERINVDVAIIDTGIDTGHSDLNVVGGKNCSTGNSYDDGNGHGTHVAGTVAALDNGIGVVGVAPGARLWAVRVLNNAGSGSWSSVACGVDWVTANAGTIEVANMSLGGGGSEPSESGCSTGDALHDAICKSVGAGVTYAVAAGNSSADAATSVPAAYDEVITVSALADFNGQAGGGAPATCRSDVDDTFADFSNYGADVDLIAPGVCINSTWHDGGYNTISGTSMASPHVAGAAALYKANNPLADPKTVKDALILAGNLNWYNSDDPDRLSVPQEPLLNVADF